MDFAWRMDLEWNGIWNKQRNFSRSQQIKAMQKVKTVMEHVWRMEKEFGRIWKQQQDTTRCLPIKDMILHNVIMVFV
jgi:hypothetical protein